LEHEEGKREKGEQWKIDTFQEPLWLRGDLDVFISKGKGGEWWGGDTSVLYERGRKGTPKGQTAKWTRMRRKIREETCNGHIEQEIPEQQSETEQGQEKRVGSGLTQIF
jgi:hypothetical protein